MKNTHTPDYSIQQQVILIRVSAMEVSAKRLQLWMYIYNIYIIKFQKLMFRIDFTHSDTREDETHRSV